MNEERSAGEDDERKESWVVHGQQERFECEYECCCVRFLLLLLLLLLLPPLDQTLSLHLCRDVEAVMVVFEMSVWLLSRISRTRLRGDHCCLMRMRMIGRCSCRA